MRGLDICSILRKNCRASRGVFRFDYRARACCRNDACGATVEPHFGNRVLYGLFPEPTPEPTAAARASVFAGVFKGSTVPKTESIIAAEMRIRPSIVNFVQGYPKV